MSSYNEFRQLALAARVAAAPVVECFLIRLREQAQRNIAVEVGNLSAEHFSEHELILSAVYIVRQRAQPNDIIVKFMQNLLSQNTQQNFNIIQKLMRETDDYEGIKWLCLKVIKPIVGVDSAGLLEDLASYNKMIYQLTTRRFGDYYNRHILFSAITLLANIIKSLTAKNSSDMTEIIDMVNVFRSLCTIDLTNKHNFPILLDLNYLEAYYTSTGI